MSLCVVRQKERGVEENLRLGQQYDLLKTISKRVPILHQQARRQAERMTHLKNWMQKTLVAPQINRRMLKDIYTQLASEEARAGLLADELKNHEKIRTLGQNLGVIFPNICYSKTSFIFQ